MLCMGQPLQVRETFPELAHKVTALGVYAEGLQGSVDDLLREAVALEAGRAAARDIGGADPERMTPLRTADYVRALFGGAASAVRVRVMEQRAQLEQHYPLLAAVDRAAASVPRHRGCVIFLEYEPDSYERTVMLVGKVSARVCVCVSVWRCSDAACDWSAGRDVRHGRLRHQGGRRHGGHVARQVWRRRYRRLP